MTREIPQYSISDLEYLNAVDFSSLTNDDAVVLGLVAVEVIRDWQLNLAVDVVLGDDLVFRAKLGTTGSGNDPWLAGKAAVATAFGEPSLLVKLRRLESGESNEDQQVLRFHGGSIPLRVNGAVVGTITTSGEPDANDHEAAAEAIRRYLEITA